MNYKKGQIVPRRLVRCKNRRTQFLWKFGCDVEVVGKTIKMKGDGGSAIMHSGRFYIGGKKGRPRVYDEALIDGLTIIGNGSDCGVPI